MDECGRPQEDDEHGKGNERRPADSNGVVAAGTQEGSGSGCRQGLGTASFYHGREISDTHPLERSIVATTNRLDSNEVRKYGFEANFAPFPQGHVARSTTEVTVTRPDLRRLRSLVRVLVTCLLPCLAGGGAVSLALAQVWSDAPSTFLDPSIDASGMGRASVSVFWGDHPNGWANPALLGYHKGLRFVYGRTQLVPELSDHVFFTTNEIMFGGGGLGARMSGKPIKALGSLRLDYGQSEATDVDGNVVGVFSSYEEIRDLAIGINLIEAMESIQRLRGGEPSRLSRTVDLSIGHAWKRVTVDLFPASIYLGGVAARGEGNERDRGALLRVTPLNQIPEVEVAGAGRDGVRCRIDASFGISQRNYLTEAANVDWVGAISEERLRGGSARLTLGLPRAAAGGIWDFLEPTIAIGATYESAKYYQGEDEVGGTPATRTGQELTLFDAISLRHGHVSDDGSTIDGDTFGVGVRIRYRKMVGVSYDYANVPQATFLGDVSRYAITAFVDPLLLWKALR